MERCQDGINRLQTPKLYIYIATQYTKTINTYFQCNYASCRQTFQTYEGKTNHERQHQTGHVYVKILASQPRSLTRHRVHVPLLSGGPRVRTVRVTEPVVIEEDQNHDNAPEVVTIADDEPSTSSVTLSPMWGSQAAESSHGPSLSPVGEMGSGQVFRPVSPARSEVPDTRLVRPEPIHVDAKLQHPQQSQAFWADLDQWIANANHPRPLGDILEDL